MCSIWKVPQKRIHFAVSSHERIARTPCTVCTEIKKRTPCTLCPVRICSPRKISFNRYWKANARFSFFSPISVYCHRYLVSLRLLLPPLDDGDGGGLDGLGKGRQKRAHFAGTKNRAHFAGTTNRAHFAGTYCMTLVQKLRNSTKRAAVASL